MVPPKVPTLPSSAVTGMFSGIRALRSAEIEDTVAPMSTPPLELKNPDEAMRRRFNILPFTFKPSKPDRGLEKKLRAEWPQILNWMVEGCVDWQKNGLLRPSIVTDATSEYFEEQDVLGLWIKECCEVGPSYWEPSHVLFQRWTVYAEAQGEDPGNFKTFAAGLKRLGFRKGRNSAGQIWKEIRLKVN